MARIDWNALRLVPGGFVQENLAERFTDLLHATTLDGRDARIYLLFEHLSTVDRLVAFRLLA